MKVLLVCAMNNYYVVDYSSNINMKSHVKWMLIYAHTNEA